MGVSSLTINGKSYVVMERAEYESMRTARVEATLPPLPARTANGHYPAREAIRVSIARRIILDRTKAKLTQKELASLAGVRVETLCRIETGKHLPSLTTIERLERALKSVNSSKRRKRSMTTK